MGLLDDVGDDHHPKCLLINEIGIIYCQGEDQDNICENRLLSFLNDGDEGSRAIAACYLSYDQEKATKHAAVLAEFRARPENESLLSFIDQQINEESDVPVTS